MVDQNLTVLFIIISILTKFPTPLAEIVTQTTTELPLWFTDVCRHSLIYLSADPLLIYWWGFEPKISYFDSSLHKPPVNRNHFSWSSMNPSTKLCWIKNKNVFLILKDFTFFFSSGRFLNPALWQHVLTGCFWPFTTVINLTYLPEACLGHN